MNDNLFELYSYRIAMKPPFKERRGLILKLIKADGSQGFGEIAPLPFFSKESLEEAKEDLLAALQGEEPKFASTRFGLKSALRSYKSVTRPLSGLLLGSEEEMMKRASFLKKEGVTTVKCKLKGHSLEASLAILKELSKDFLLRIDFNKTGSLDLLSKIVDSIPLHAIDYFEEPAIDLKKESPLYQKIALDESLQDGKTGFIAIIKPTIYQKSLPPCRCVYSSAFESGIGLSHIALLSKEEELLGIDTLQFFENDLLKEKIIFKEGTITTPSSLEPIDELLTLETKGRCHARLSLSD